MKKVWILRLLLIIGLIYFAGFIATRTSGCQVHTTTAIVNGDSLRGDLENGEMVKVQKGYYVCNAVKRGDIVAYSLYGAKWPLVKVVRAVPGDTFTIAENVGGQFHIEVAGTPLRTANGELYALDSGRSKVLRLAEQTYRGVIPPGTYLILGDIPGGSFDSTKLGLVPTEKLIGKIVH